MSYLDIILIVLLALAAFHGWRKGLITELATLAALILGVFAGYYFSDYLSGIIEKAFDYHGPYINIFSFIIIFIAIIVLVKLLARIITKAVETIQLGFLNKIGGMIFGVLKAAFILSVIIYFINRFDESHKIIKTETRSQSVLFPVIEKIAPMTIPAMKEKIAAIKNRESE